MIYSYHSEDPINNEQFLQHEVRGSLRINLFGLPLNDNAVPDDTPYFDIRLENVSHIIMYDCFLLLCVWLLGECASKGNNPFLYSNRTATNLQKQNTLYTEGDWQLIV